MPSPPPVPIRFGDRVRVVDRPAICGRVRHMSAGAVLIELADGSRYADVPENVVRIEERMSA